MGSVVGPDILVIGFHGAGPTRRRLGICWVNHAQRLDEFESCQMCTEQ
jgi:hypothetical protein